MILKTNWILSFIILNSSIRNSQFIIHNSQFTIHNSQFIIHNSQFIIHNSPFIIHNVSIYLLFFLGFHDFYNSLGKTVFISCFNINIYICYY